MKAVLTMVAAATLVLGGCRSAANSAPYAAVPLEELKTTGTYDVLNTTEGSSSGGVLLFFFPIGFEDKRGQSMETGGSANPLVSVFESVASVFMPDAEGRVRSAALYNAIEAQAGADAILAPRYETETTNYIIYTHVTAKCRGKGLRYNVTAR